jgi:YrbI family 3-deoxy-D-manno-octulosonate 8-phosphate phosphatase
MNILAIIPARGGSKGIPRKNVLPLAGKPLLAYNIKAALASRFINRVVVSTDDAEIGAVAQQFGAEVVWRPAEISGDLASSESALLHVLDHLRKIENYEVDILVFLQCTSPLTIAEDIDGTIQALLDGEADSALAVIPFHYFLWQSADDGDAQGINHHKSVRPLRQERDLQFLETGAVYVMRVHGFIKAQHRFFGKTVLYEMSAKRRLEIDELADFQVAEILIQQQAHENVLGKLPESIAAIVFDFDGVFTDNSAIVLEDGSEAVTVNRGDGMGIKWLRETGVPILILSTEPNPVVRARAQKLGLPVIHGVERKWQILQDWLDKRDLQPTQVVYVGNDLNDAECMSKVGCAVAVADAVPEIIKQADIVLQNKGGQGAVREICDLILKRDKE